MKQVLSNNQIVVQLDRVEKVFGSDENCRVALDSVSFIGRRGELSLILGPSGSGKTTFLTVAAGLQPPSNGRVLLFGHSIENLTSAEFQKWRAQRLGFMFQDFRLIESLTVTQNIKLVLKFAGWNRVDSNRRIEQLLGQYKVEYLRDRYPRDLSQGEKQRIAIIRAVANGGELIFADEPTACLDTKQGEIAIRQLAQCAHDEKACVIVVSHDIRLKDYAEKIYYLQDGSLAEIPKTKFLYPADEQFHALNGTFFLHGCSQRKEQRL